MSETNLQSAGRVLYIEPNDMYNKMPNGIPHPYEDYCISVDLTIECNDRNSLGPVGPSKMTQGDRVYNYSSDKSTISFIGGTNGFLTTNFTDIHGANSEQNTKECLGIESITIQYNSWYVPQVNIRFVDVRGASLFGPQEQGYVNTVRNEDKFGHEPDTSIQGGSFFKSLFSFPYPMFKLKVKGFYGKEVTYNLSVEDFQGNFNADNGNFEVDVRFIGYMFGVYTDIPMNYLMISPYIKDIGDKYWEQQKSNGRFKYFGDSVPYYKYPELIDKVAHLSPKEDDIDGEGIDYSTRKRTLEGKISALTVLRDDMESLLGSVFDEYELCPFNSNDIKGYALLGVSRKYEKICVLNKPKSDETGKTICDLTESYDVFLRKVKTYNQKYGKELSTDILGFNIENNTRKKITPIGTGDDFKVYKVLDNGNFSDETTINAYDYFNHTTRYKTKIYPDEAITEFEWIQKVLIKISAVKGAPLYIYHPADHVMSLPSWIVEINDKIKKTEKELNEVKKYIEKHRDEAISKQLGFGVSIGNAFEMAFAHMETFMYVFNHYLRQIKNVQDMGRRTLKSLNGFSSSNTDLPRSIKEDTPIPPFTLFYKNVENEGGNSNTNEKSSKRKVIMWPGDISGIDPSDFPEIDFVNRLIEAGKGYAKESEELETLREINEASKQAQANGDTQTFIPVTFYDLSNPSSHNPYTYLSTMDRGNKVWEGMIYTFCMRLFYWYRSAGPQNKREVYDDFGKIEAYNLYLAHTNILPAVKEYLNNRKDRSPNLNFGEISSYLTTDSSEENRKLYDTGKGVFKKHLLIRDDKNYKYDWTDWVDMSADVLTTAGTIESRIIKVKYFPTNIWSPLKVDTVKVKDRTRDDANSECIIYLYDKLTNGDKLVDKTLNKGAVSFIDANVIDKNKRTLDYNAKYLNKLEGSPIKETKDNYEKYILPSLTPYTYVVGIAANNETQRSTREAAVIANSTKMLTKNGIGVELPGKKEENSTSYYLSSPAFVKICVGKNSYEYYQLYGHPLFYEQNKITDDHERRLKAKAFLHAVGIPIATEGWLGVKNTHTIPYYEAIKEGALWYRQRWMKEHPGEDLIKIPADYIPAGEDCLYCTNIGIEFLNTNTFCEDETLCFIEKNTGLSADTYSTYEELEKSDNNKDALADLFEDWALNVYPDLENLFELKIGDGYTDSAENFKRNVVDSCARAKSPKVKTLNNNLANTDGAVNTDFYDAESTLHVKNKKALDIPAKRVSDVQSKLLKEYEKYTIMIDMASRNKDSVPVMTVPIDVVSAATVSFLNELIELYKPQLEKDYVEESNGTIPYDPDGDVDLKISTYLTLKNLYDRWICSVKTENKWKLNGGEDSEFNHFKYIDGFYRKIKERAPVNFEYISEIASQMMTSSNIKNEATSLNYQGRSFYDFLASICQKNQMMLLSLPMENEFTDATGITEMFDVKPYSQMDRRDTSCFVCLYSNKPSQHLEIEDDGNVYKYATDGFNIANANGSILNVTELIPQLADIDVDAYPIPAFGVTYAKQNQSIFKKIHVNMQNPQVTEASIAATQLIASRYSEGPNKTALYGQDLYRIYSNYSYTCSVEMLGNAQIMPLTYFQLNNIPLFRGVYMIINIEHTISAGDMQTKFTGVRMSKYEVPLVKDDGLFNDPFIETNYTNRNKGGELPPLNDDYQRIRKYTIEMGDLIWSNTANERGIDNRPTDTTHRDNLLNLQIRVQDIQDAWAGYCASNNSYQWAKYDGIYVSSGYRSPDVNAAVGGKSNSAHSCGCAADLQVCSYDTTNADVNSIVSGRHNGVASISRDYTEQVFYPFLVKYLTESNQTWDQVIDEKQSNGSKWTHFSPISCNGKTRKQVFELINGSNPNKK